MTYLVYPLVAQVEAAKQSKEHKLERTINTRTELPSDDFVCCMCGKPATEAVKFRDGSVRYYCEESHIIGA